jgi:drug/metabolite transporter (DMT)-like permease
MENEMALRDWFWVILLGAIWGCSFLFNAVLIREIGPLWVSALRVSIGALGCWAVFIALRKPLPRDPRLYWQLLLLGVIGYAIPFALFPLSQQHLASGVTAIINALTPITTVIVSHFWRGGERATWLKSLGVVAGFGGAAILAVPALQSGGTSQLWAIGTCILATLCYAVSLNYTRRFAKIEPTTIATLALTGAAIVGTSAALIFEGIPVITRLETWGAALGIGLLATTFAFLIMYRILPRIGATNFTSVTFIAPISAIIFGVTLLGETILPTHYLGMAAIFLGLLLIDGRLFKRWLRAPA